MCSPNDYSLQGRIEKWIPRYLVTQNAGCVQVLAVLPEAPGDGFEKPDRPQRKDDPGKICQLQNAKPHRIPWKVRDTLPSCSLHHF